MPIQSESGASMLWNARFTAVLVVGTAAAAQNFVNSLNRVYFRFYVHQILALLPPTTINIFNNHQFTSNREREREREQAEVCSFCVFSWVAKLYLYVPSVVRLSVMIYRCRCYYAMCVCVFQFQR